VAAARVRNLEAIDYVKSGKLEQIRLVKCCGFMSAQRARIRADRPHSHGEAGRLSIHIWWLGPAYQLENYQWPERFHY